VFRSRPPAPPKAAPRSVVDLFGRDAQRVVLAAEAQAQADGSAAVEVHHLLLALTAVTTPVAWTFATRGLDEAVLRDALDRRGGVPFPPSDRRVPQVPDRAAPRVPFAPDTKEAMATAVMAARRGRGTPVQPADLAVAALGSTSPTIVAVLDELGLDGTALVQALAQV